MRKEIAKAVGELVDGIEKRFGRGAIVALEDGAPPDAIEVIPSGFPALDAALGVGGYPRGRIVEIFGPEASGKTTLCLRAICEAQRAGGVASFIDAEHDFDPAYARSVGVDLAHVLVSQPDSGEQALEIAEALARSGAISLIVIDSAPALTPQAAIDGHGAEHQGLHARLMSQSLRKLTALCHKTGTTILFVNQLRQKIGSVFGAIESDCVAPLKFYSSVRMDVRRIGPVPGGFKSRIKIVKNKAATPFKVAELEMAVPTQVPPDGTPTPALETP